MDLDVTLSGACIFHCTFVKYTVIIGWKNDELFHVTVNYDGDGTSTICAMPKTDSIVPMFSLDQQVSSHAILVL
jgi:hypothetical protein